jgi:adenylate cyclase
MLQSLLLMQAKLKVRPAEGEPFEVEVGNTATIGRSRDNTVSLHLAQHVSRQHAIIRCHNAFQYQIMDLGSRNGTFVNGRRVITPTLLTHGAVIRITNNEMVFEQCETNTEDPTYDVTLAAGTDATKDQNAIVAVMVCDIRGFSTMSEMLAEEQLARNLGEWFRDAGNIVHEAGGTIDKFIGDAILAYWTKDNAKPGEETQNALASAFKLQAASRTKHWPVGDRAFEIAVALHHGIVTCGNIGLIAQRDATIIGDTVNTVFRIESVMKALGQKIAASHDFIHSLPAPPTATLADLGEHQLKGKNQAVRLFGIS